ELAMSLILKVRIIGPRAFAVVTANIETQSQGLRSRHPGTFSRLAPSNRVFATRAPARRLEIATHETQPFRARRCSCPRPARLRRRYGRRQGAAAGALPEGQQAGEAA